MVHVHFRVLGLKKQQGGNAPLFDQQTRSPLCVEFLCNFHRLFGVYPKLPRGQFLQLLHTRENQKGCFIVRRGGAGAGGGLTLQQRLPLCPKAAVSTCSWVCWLLRWLLLWDPGNEWEDILLCTLPTLLCSLYLDGDGRRVRDRQLRSAAGGGVLTPVRVRVLKKTCSHNISVVLLRRLRKTQEWLRLNVESGEKHHVFCCFADVRV